MGYRRFPRLSAPTLFLASPGDMAYLRDVARGVIHEVSAGNGETDDLDVFAWDVATSETPFDDRTPAQEQLPRPDDPLCRGVIAFFGEWIGRPLAEDFPLEGLDPVEPGRVDLAYRLVHPWRPDAAAAGGFPLTGSTFEVLATIAAHRRAREQSSARPPGLFLRFVGPPEVLEEPNVGRAAWGNRRLRQWVQREFGDDEDEELRRRAIIRTQLEQLRNFAGFLNQVLGHVTNFVADEDEAADQLKRWLERDVGLAAAPSDRDPFKGLRHYDVEDAAVFYGRENDRREAMRTIRSLEHTAGPKWYWVRGVSGAGKSSFLRAGLVGHMVRRSPDREGCAHLVIRPDELVRHGDDGATERHGPLRLLFRLCLSRVCALGREATDSDTAAASRLTDFDAIADDRKAQWAARVVGESLGSTGDAAAGGSGRRRLVVGLDQFEEAVDLLGDAGRGPDWESLLEFVTSLSQMPGILVLATIREDRLAALVHQPRLASLYRQSAQACTFLDFPSATDLAQVIRRPFETVQGLVLSGDLVTTLTDRIREFVNRGGTGRSTATLLPLVSLTLERLYREVALPLVHEHRNLLPAEASGDEPGSDGARPGDAQAQFERAAETGAPHTGAVVLTAANAGGHLEIEGAITALAEDAVNDAKSAAGPNWDDAAIGTLLRRLIAWVGSADQRFRLPPAEWPADDAAAALARAMRARRLIVDEPGERIRLVHEAVIDNWPAARAWLEHERPLLDEIPQLLRLATRWRDQALSEEVLERASYFQDVPPAARLLTLWFDLLDDVPRDPDPDHRALLRDFCLALIAHHDQPAELVVEAPRQPPHFHLPVAYRRTDIVRRMLSRAPEAVRLRRADARTALFFPAFQGHLELLALLLEHGADADAADDQRWRPIHAACMSGSLDVAARLVEAGASLDAGGAPGGTAPIHLAASGGHVAALDFLVTTRRVDVDLRDEQGFTPLMRAASANQAAAVRTLVALGANVQTTLRPDRDDDFGWTALHLAARDRATDALDALIDAGLDINRGLVNGATALHIGAYNGHVESMQRLIARSAGLEPRALNEWTSGARQIRTTIEQRRDATPRASNGRFDFTPLHMAVSEGRDDAVALLLDQGADADARTGSGATPLHLAAAANRPEIVERLRSHGASPELRDARGRTPFHEAIDRHAFNAARALLQHGAAIDAPVVPTGSDAGGTCVRTTPLHKAAGDGDEAILRFLIRQRVDAGAADERGRTALHYAAAGGHEALVEWLVRRGVVGPDVTDRDGMTALHLACRRGTDRVVKALLAAYRPDWSSLDGTVTPLHLAASTASASCLTLLLDAGHPIDVRDPDGWSPLHCATQAGSEACVDALLTAGVDPRAGTDRPGIGALQIAAQVGQIGCIRRLLQAPGLAPDHAPGHTPTPVMLAMRYRQFDAVAALVAAGASIDARDPQTGIGLADAYREHVGRAVALGARDARHPALESLLEAGGRHLDLPDEASPEPRGLVSVARRLFAHADPGAALLQPGATAFCPDLNRTTPNPWTTVEGRDRHALLRQLSPVDGRHVLSPDDTEVHSRPLSWYPRFTLLHLSNAALRAHNVRLCYLTDGEGLYRLNGTSPPIHEVNARAPVTLDEGNVLDYLRFFCFFVRGEAGPFYITETPDDPLLPRAMDETTKKVIQGTSRPAALEGVNERGHYLAEAIVFYSTAAFIAHFAIQPGGMVEMLDDEPIAADLPSRMDVSLQ